MILRLVSRILRVVLALLLVGVVAALAMVWAQTQREYENFHAEREQAREALAVVRAEREHKEAYLRAFLNDPAFVERVVRERLGYVGPGDILFRFEEVER